MVYEDPYALLSRLRLGREEYCQRLLTALIVGGQYPRWNSRNRPSAAGMLFLRGLDELSFAVPDGNDSTVFVDELLLPSRSEEDRGGSPDQAVLWPDRVWLIELKTESGSHRADQLPLYFDLAHHHFPDVRVDITYLTPTLSVPAPVAPGEDRYSHVTWTQVAPLLERVWGSSPDPNERAVVATLLRAIQQMHIPSPGWRDRLVGSGAPPNEPPSPEPPEGAPPVGDRPERETEDDAVTRALQPGLATAELVARDGQQRAVPCPEADLDDLLALRKELRDLLQAHTAQDLHTVRPWLWNQAKSGGQALSDEGRATGFEVRLSRYTRQDNPAPPGN